MSKITLTFNCDTAQEAELKLRAEDLAQALYEIRQQLFRPARKHGYPQHILNQYPVLSDDKIFEIVSALEKLYNEILDDLAIKHFEE